MTPAIILFLAAMLPGSAVFFLKRIDQSIFRSSLVFSGAFFFGITIMHILPEIYMTKDYAGVSVFVLAGFFLQQVIEIYTSGVEHGHLHPVPSQNHQHHHSAVALLIGLGLHSLLEGTIISHQYEEHAHHAGQSVLGGVVLHKMTAAFALMTVLVCQVKNRKSAFLFLLIFALCTPLGVFLGEQARNTSIDPEWFNYLFAIVAGSFLHISTTIFFESSPGHQYKFKNFLSALFGVGMAILTEFLL